MKGLRDEAQAKIQRGTGKKRTREIGQNRSGIFDRKHQVRTSIKVTNELKTEKKIDFPLLGG